MCSDSKIQTYTTSQPTLKHVNLCTLIRINVSYYDLVICTRGPRPGFQKQVNQKYSLCKHARVTALRTKPQNILYLYLLYSYIFTDLSFFRTLLQYSICDVKQAVHFFPTAGR